MRKRTIDSPLPLPPDLHAAGKQTPDLYGPETPDATSRVAPDRRIVEIDGEAEPVYDVMPPSSAVMLVDSLEALIEDLQDETIMAGLEKRRLTVGVDETAIFRLALLNRADTRACYEVRLDGWLQEEWVTMTVAESPNDSAHRVQLWLEPRERTLIHIAISPPRSPASRAGLHAFAVLIRTVHSPHRMARLGAMLTIRPFVDLHLGEVQPQRPAIAWAKRSTTLLVPVTNQGNAEAEIYVHGQAAAVKDRRPLAAACRFVFYRASDRQPHARRITLVLPPGKTAQIVTQIMPAKQPLLALRQQVMPVQLAVGLSNAQDPPWLLRTNLTCLPLIGPWHLLTLFGIVLLSGLSMVLVAALTTMLAFGPVASPAPTPLPGPENVPTTPPPITIVVQLAQPASVSPNEPARTNMPAPIIDAALPAPSQPDPSVPIVQPDQISVPGGATPQPGALLPPPAFSARQSTPATMTYQQMFQEIATRYDLDWRMLAAQAYIESSYDTVALNASGAMGIMQIMPGTWREWSSAVNASDPFDAYSNVMVAAVYLDHLRSRLGERGYPQMEWMLVAYNWGIDKLTQHLDAGLGWDALPAESRQYALDILTMAETIPP